MALSITLNILYPYIIISGGGSLNGIETSNNDLQFGIVEQTFPFCNLVEEGSYILFNITNSKIININGSQYFIVDQKNIYFIEEYTPAP